MLLALLLGVVADGPLRAEMPSQFSPAVVMPPLGKLDEPTAGTVAVSSLVALNSAPDRTKAVRVLPGSLFTDEEMKAFRLVTHLVNLDLSYNAHLTLAKLPIKDLKLTGLNLRWCSRVFPSVLQQVMKLSTLTKLDLSHVATVTDGSIEDIAQLAELEELDLSGTAITDHTLKEVAKLKKLRVLRLLQMPALTERGFAHLAGMPALKELTLSGSVGVNDAALKHLSGKLPSLQRLDLSGCTNLTAAAAESLGGFEALETFDASGCAAANDAWVAAVAQNRNLTELRINLPPNIAGVGVRPPGDKAVASLLKRSELRVLGLAGWSVTDASTFRIGQKLTKLEELNLRGCRGVLPHAMEHLVALTKLKHLDLGYLRYKDTDFRDLAKVTSLESLSLQGMPHLTERSLDQLKVLPALTSLDLSRTPLADHQLTKLEAFERLQQLDLTACVNVTGGNLGKLRNLRRLVLDACPLKDGFEAGLRELRFLAEISLVECPQYRGRQLDALRDLRSLRLLTLGGEALAEEAATALRQVSGLEVLNLVGTGMMDKDALKIRDLKRTLRFVGVYHCAKVSRVATKALREDLASARVAVWPGS